MVILTARTVREQLQWLYAPPCSSTRNDQTNDGKTNERQYFNLFVHPRSHHSSPSIHPSIGLSFSLPSSQRNSCTYPSPSRSSSASSAASYASSWRLMLPEALPSRKLRWAKQEVVMNSDSFPVWILERRRRKLNPGVSQFCPCGFLIQNSTFF